MTEAPRSWLRLELSLELRSGLTSEDLIGLCGSALQGLDCLGLEDLGEDAGQARVAAYLPLGTERAAIEAALCELPGGKLLDLQALDDPGWVEQFNESLEPVDLGARFTILPRPGLTAAVGRQGLVIEAGLAFGTGHHETTSLAVEWLEECVEHGDLVADVGTGTGILAAVAIMLGARRVLAIDNDPEALTVARQVLTQLERPGDVELKLAADPSGLGSGHDVVVANIIAGISFPMLPALHGLLAPGGSLILSGLLLSDEEEADARLRELGVEPSWKRDGEWCSAAAHA